MNEWQRRLYFQQESEADCEETQLCLTVDLASLGEAELDIACDLFEETTPEEEETAPSVEIPGWVGAAWNPGTKRADFEQATEIANQQVHQPFDETFFDNLAAAAVGLPIQLPSDCDIAVTPSYVDIYNYILSSPLVSLINGEFDKLANWVKVFLGAAGFTFGDDPWAPKNEYGYVDIAPFSEVWNQSQVVAFREGIFNKLLDIVSTVLSRHVSGPPGSVVAPQVDSRTLAEELKAAVAGSMDLWGQVIPEAVTNLASSLPVEHMPQGMLETRIQDIKHAITARTKQLEVPAAALHGAGWGEEMPWVWVGDISPVLSGRTGMKLLNDLYSQGKIQAKVTRRKPSDIPLIYMPTEDAIKAAVYAIANPQSALDRALQRLYMVQLLDNLHQKGLLPVEEILAPFVWMAYRTSFQANPQQGFTSYKEIASRLWDFVKERAGAYALEEFFRAGGDVDNFYQAHLYSAVWKAARDFLVELAEQDQGVKISDPTTGQEFYLLPPNRVKWVQSFLAQPHVDYHELAQRLGTIRDRRYPRNILDVARSPTYAEWLVWALETIPREMLVKPYYEDRKTNKWGQEIVYRYGFPYDTEVYKGWEQLMFGLIYPYIGWMEPDEFRQLLHKIQPGETIFDYFARAQRQNINPLSGVNDELMARAYQEWQRLRDEGVFAEVEPEPEVSEAAKPRSKPGSFEIR